MGLFGVTVNGQPRFNGTILAGDGTGSLASLGFTSEPDIGFIHVSANTMGFINAGAVQALFQNNLIQLGSGGSFAWCTTADASGAAADTKIIRQAANTVEFFDGSTTASTVLLGVVDFRQTVSTFAQTGTLTNAPAGTNPTAWIEVRVGGSTKRIPAW